MKIKQKDEKSIFSREQKMTNEPKDEEKHVSPTDAKPHVSGSFIS